MCYSCLPLGLDLFCVGPDYVSCARVLALVVLVATLTLNIGERYDGFRVVLWEMDRWPLPEGTILLSVVVRGVLCDDDNVPADALLDMVRAGACRGIGRSIVGRSCGKGRDGVTRSLRVSSRRKGVMGPP